MTRRFLDRITVFPSVLDRRRGRLVAGSIVVACALGRTGQTRSKREGDGASPVGSFALGQVFYRSDQLPRPRTGLPLRATRKSDGWCDDPGHPDYNRQIRLPHPDGGPPLTGTNPIAIAIPSSDARPVVADVSMGAVTHGDVLTGAARPEELVPFGGPQAHKAFALAVGVELLVGALAGPEPGALVLAARPEHDPVPELRASAEGRRLPGDRSSA